MTDEFDRELAEVRRLAAMEVSPEPVRNTAMEERIIQLQLDLAARDAEVARLKKRTSNQRRGLRQLNKAHAILWKVLGLQAEHIVKARNDSWRQP